MDWSRTGMFISIAVLALIVGLLALTLIHVEKSGDEKNKKIAFRYNYV
jgi:ACDE family multidrug resistance protein